MDCAEAQTTVGLAVSGSGPKQDVALPQLRTDVRRSHGGVTSVQGALLPRSSAFG